MNSVIFRTATRILVSLMLLFSVFVMIRGHNEPGGGFVGGLIASTGLSLFTLAYGPATVRKAIKIDPRYVAMAGLGTAVTAGMIGTIWGHAFMKGMWTEVFGIALGTPVLFDLGVYLVVIGAVMTLILAMEEEG
jgi:multicomponent Na+:H+ antiporter subunit B